MITKRGTEGGKKVEVTFAVPADHHVQPVFVVGDFNDWELEATPLVERRADTLCAKVVVATGGRYAFRYRTSDNRWFNDEAADDYEGNEFGGMNGVIAT